MKTRLSVIACLAAFLAMIAMPALAQSKGKLGGFMVNFVVNVPHATIIVDNVVIKGNVVSLPPGNHMFRVTAPGYNEFAQAANVQSPMTIRVPLMPLGFLMTVNANVGGVMVFVDGTQIPGNALNVPPGTHSVRVSAGGYQDYNVVVNVTGPTIVNAQLQPIAFPLTVNANVGGAFIFVDGAQIAGNVINVPAGAHSVRVTANGYQEYMTNVNVSSPVVVSAQLVPAGYALSVSANIAGATVTVNNVVKGAVPYSEMLPPGVYNVTVTAPGYNSYATSVSLSSPVTVSAQLVAPMATVSFSFPQSFIDPNAKGREGHVRIFVDGRMINPSNEVPQGIQILPGRHQVAVSSGGLFTQVGAFDFAAGNAYTVELFMELRIRAR